MAPATGRNRDPILAILRRCLPPTGTVLEVASGTGEHAVYFGAQLPELEWQPTDPDPRARESIAGWVEATAVPNVRAPLDLDVTQTPWGVDAVDAVVAINMVHIAPWCCCEALMAEAGRMLPPGGVLYVYGPFHVTGVPTAPSNHAFDVSLREQDPRWGLRLLDDVVALATESELQLHEKVPMPANNLSLVFKRND